MKNFYKNLILTEESISTRDIYPKKKFHNNILILILKVYFFPMKTKIKHFFFLIITLLCFSKIKVLGENGFENQARLF